ncbi:hypothetical protein BZA77DRAFT_314397 [Pyronema omphalodes]|nr:hypothetical protein BZA77DRAFT_314397 [Pyronema omphalodes]
MVQTLRQRVANDRFANNQEKIMGKNPELRTKIEGRKKTLSKKKKTVIPAWLLYTLLALLVGGLFLEPLRLLMSWIF